MTTLSFRVVDSQMRSGTWHASTEAAGWCRAAERWYYVARYHRPTQLGRRLLNQAARLRKPSGWEHLLKRNDGALETRPGLVLGPVIGWKVDVRRSRGAAENAARLRAGQYTFLNEQLELPDPIDWRLRDHSAAGHLWRFHLHYHEFLLDLLADGDRESVGRCWNVVRQWIEGNPLRERRELADAWHPFCISRRLLVWILLWQAAPPQAGISELVLASLFAQASYLERHLERDLGGNHLLENARALAYAGAFFVGSSAERWLCRSEEIVGQELPEQILAHGEHFERSPMYHASMLELLLDVRDVTANVRPALSRLCGDAAASMAEYLGCTLHPDGEIPLLGDSCLGEASPPRMLLCRADRLRGRGAAPAQADGARLSGDTWTWRNGDDFLLFDAGPVGPDHLPAHAHADLLTFEATVQGRRLIVDSGLFGYGDDDMRQYCRSSLAHNVLQVDDCDHCDMWSRFRMGYRGRPDAVMTGSEHGFDWVSARHNAYRRLGVPEVGRWIGCRAGGPWLVVDWAAGAGRHLVTSRLHFHPDVLVQKVSADALRIELKNASFRLRCLTPGDLRITTGWYCPGFGRRIASPVAEWTARAELPMACGWTLVWPGQSDSAVFQKQDEGVLLALTDGKLFTCEPLLSGTRRCTA